MTASQPAAEPARPSAFPAYLLGLASWFVPLGIQMVLFPWLVAVVLHMDAFAVGVAQAAVLAPSLLFLPLGGLVADRGNARRCAITCSMPCRRWRSPSCCGAAASATRC